MGTKDQSSHPGTISACDRFTWCAGKPGFRYRRSWRPGGQPRVKGVDQRTRILPRSREGPQTLVDEPLRQPGGVAGPATTGKSGWRAESSGSGASHGFEDGGGWLVGGEEGLQSQFGDRDIDRGAEMGQRGQQPKLAVA